jgi:hypothetical protein
MRRLIDRCAGIDVGQALLVVCVRVVNGTGELVQEIRSSGRPPRICWSCGTGLPRPK